MDQAKHLIADEHDLHIGVQGAQRGQFVEEHLEGAVAADDHCLLARLGDFSAQGGGEGVAHGAQTAGGQETPPLEGQVGAGPDLILAHIHAYCGVLVQPGA